MTRLPLSPKLRFASLWPALGAVAVATALLALAIPRQLERRSIETLQDALDLFHPVLRQQLQETAVGGSGAAETAALQEWVSSIAGTSGLRLTLVAADGTVVADSTRSPEQLASMDDHGDRPEIRQAQTTGRGSAVRQSATTGRRYAYAARTLDLGGQRWTLRLATPLGESWEFQWGLAWTMALAVAFALLAMTAVSLWLDLRLFRPLARLIAAAGALAKGNRSPVGIPQEEELARLARALNRLAASVDEQVAAAEAERDHVQAILASMSEGVLVVDDEGRTVFANPALRRLFGIEGKVEGRLPLEVTRRRELEELVERTLEGGELQRAEVETRGGERRTLSLSGAALDTAHGGAVVVVRDVTESARLGEMRRDFVANVSHELKTPLSAIRGYAETLRDGALDEPSTARRFLDRILDQCRRLQALLTDLLTLSRLESLDLQPEAREPVDLARVVRRAVELVQQAARERRVSVGVRDPGPLPPVPGDGESIERLVLNLLENAVKYNRPGGRVEVRLENRAGVVVLEVEDDGIGIPEKALPRIFERFYRVDKGRSREEGGTGLGLAIVKHVAQAHDGRVEVESEPGRGTLFRVLLPTVDRGATMATAS